MKKRILALLLAGVMVFSLAACGSSSSSSDDTADSSADDTADDSASEDTSAASDIVLAMITDSGDITDESFNQMTYEACVEWAEEYGVDFTYYKPESDSDEARIASVDQAVAAGATVIVMPGYLFAATIAEVSVNYPDVKFIGLDVGESDITGTGISDVASECYNTENTYLCTYQEQLCGYMAGYAAVMMGYTHLGFLGGMSVPAVLRYGYGFVQGANQAAIDLGIEDEVVVEYVYGGQFYGDSDITATMDTWYGTLGVEVVFACGGGIYTSAAEAAAKVDGKVIGVDSDQSTIIDSYGEGMTITSAMKALDVTVKTVLTAIVDGEWDEYVGTIGNWGLASEDPTENYCTLPIDTTLWTDSFTVEDFEALVADMYNGVIEVSSDVTEADAEVAMEENLGVLIDVVYYGTIK